MEIFKNEHFSILEKEEKIYILVHASGFDINHFAILLKKHPTICVKNFLNLKNALANPSGDLVEIGILRPKIEITKSRDNMTATLKLNIDSFELESSKQKIIENIIKELKTHNITYGINYSTLTKELEVQKDLLIAEGVFPINGEDAKIKYIDLPPRKPTIKDDGTTDFYELHLIHEIKKNDYLGEKILPTEGINGKNIEGEELPSKSGKDLPFSYDRKTVGEFKENEKIILRALINGALTFQNGKIGVLNHLVIDGDVGYETGNINFDGHITIKGTVQDGFSVIADKDISIEGDMGIGCIEKIISKNGDIYIKGGVSGKGKAYIEAANNVFVKYANACTIVSKENINIGFYALDSYLTSKTIIVNPEKGKIIGGEINAGAKVVSNTIGNQYERKTIINVKGFNRQEIKKELDDLLINYKKCIIELEKNKREMNIYENSIGDYQQLIQMEEYRYYQNIHEKLMKEVSQLEQNRKSLMEYLESKGEGEVSILKGAYPKTFLEIKNLQKIINKITNGTFYSQDNQLHSE